MSEKINPLVVDLSHWDPAEDYARVKADGIVGVIYKATEGQDYGDATYVQQREAAKKAGLKWGAYHFADGSSIAGQIDNFLRFATPGPDELFCLDWEDNGGDCMSLDDVKVWIASVEQALDRPNQCVLYGGNTIKEALGSVVDTFLGKRRLWLCQYGTQPEVPKSWGKYWLWQFTDGSVGPAPHTVDGIGACDINSFDGTAGQLVAEWATGMGTDEWGPPKPLVEVHLTIPEGVELSLSINGEVVLSQEE